VAVAVALTALLAAACGSPDAVTLSDGGTAGTVARDTGSDMLNRDVPPEPADDAGEQSDTSAGPTTTAAIAPLGPEGAFPAERKPGRILIRPMGSENWHWVDAQTGDYVGPGSAPVEREFDGADLVSSRASLPPNCEEEGSGLHIQVGHPTVQKSGRFIAVESVFQAADCSGEPFAVRGVAIDRTTGVAEVRFRLGSDQVRVSELEYDETGTWLLISFTDGTLEWQGGSGRVVVEPKDAAGVVVVVAEASWGSEPPTASIPGRAFVPTAFGAEDPGVPFPAERLDLEHGGEAWVVVLMSGPASSPSVATAVATAEAAGYGTGWTDCDVGATHAVGWTGASVEGDQLGAVSVYLSSEQDARVAAQKFEAAGTPAVPTLVNTFCLD